MSSKPRPAIDEKMSSSPGGDDADAEYLDEFFDAAVANAQHDEALDLERWSTAKPHLAAQLRTLAELALATVAPASGAQQTISGYTVIRELGHGAMGCVYLAEQHAVGRRTVALKVLPPAVAMSATARARFLLETRSLARIQHPNVVTIHDVIAQPDALAYAMEWIDGPTFAALIDGMRPADSAAPTDDSTARSRLRATLGSESGASGWVQFVARTGVAIARALQTMHEAGLIHRDVKPSNILLRKDGSALLSDFGLVSADDASMHTLTGDMLGTIGYAAPELLRGEHGAASPAADVFGLGATLYHALCFQLPFGHASAASVLRRIEAGDFVAPRELVRSLPRDLDTIVSKALHADPQRRYASAAEFADDLQRLLDLRPIRARRAGAIERSWQRIRRNSRSFVAGSLGITLGLCAAGVVGWQVWERAQRPARIERLVERARIGWIDLAAANFAFYAVADPNVRRDSSGRLDATSSISGPAMSEIIALYDAAIALDCDDADVLIEREVVRNALLCARHPSEAVLAPKADDTSSHFAKRCPMTTAAAADWQRFVDEWEQHRAILESATELDRRALGLLAYMCQVHRMCIDCLSSCDVLERRDPLAQMFLGELRAMEGRPELAYPLLLHAWDACPTAPRIGASLADVAVQCGDAATAARVLEKLRGVRLSPIDTTLIRVRADLDWLRGDEQEARRGYEVACKIEGNPRAYLRLAQLAELHGDHEAAWRRYLDLLFSYASWPDARRGFVREVEAWWRGLDEAVRERHVRAEVDASKPPALPDSLALLRTNVRNESIANYERASDGSTLHVALIALKRFPPIAVQRERWSVPWITTSTETVDAPASNDGLLELRRMVALTEVIDCGPRRWLDVPHGVRTLLVRAALAWDRAIAASTARDDPTVLALSRAFGVLVRSLAMPLARH